MSSPSKKVVEGPDDDVVLEAPIEPQTPMGAMAQYERNMKIVAARARRTPWSKIAATNGLSIRRCQQVWEEWKTHNPTLREHDPIEIVDELLMGYQAALEDFDATVQVAGHDAVRVGALNGKLRAYREMAELLQAIGVLPKDLGTLQIHIDAQVTAERVLSVLERAGVPESVYDELLRALGGPPASLSQN